MELGYEDLGRGGDGLIWAVAEEKEALPRVEAHLEYFSRGGARIRPYEPAQGAASGIDSVASLGPAGFKVVAAEYGEILRIPMVATLVAIGRRVVPDSRVQEVRVHGVVVGGQGLLMDAIVSGTVSRGAVQVERKPELAEEVGAPAIFRALHSLSSLSASMK